MGAISLTVIPIRLAINAADGVVLESTKLPHVARLDGGSKSDYAKKRYAKCYYDLETNSHSTQDKRHY